MHLDDKGQIEVVRAIVVVDGEVATPITCGDGDEIRMPDEVAPAIDEMNREGAKGRCTRKG